VNEPRSWKTWVSPIIELSNNWISAAGVALVTASAILWLMLILNNVGHDTGNPYLGILLFMVLPGTFFLGLALIPLGIWLLRRRVGAPPPAAIDLRNPRVRRMLIFIAVITFVNVIIASHLSYSTVSYMESVTFCGTTCHSVMAPEYTAYQNSPHSRVECVKCHIGPGASWFVKSKLSGAHQVIAVNLNTFERPIPTPVENLRPARDTCEGCHWPDKFAGDRLRIIPKYADDEANTRTMTVLMMRIGGGRTPHGIHGAHVGPGVSIRYAATDRKRQNIAMIQLNKDGQKTEFYGKDVKPADVANVAMREMDCVDCHNRPTHIFELPERGMDRILSAGEASPTLPFLKKKGMEVLTAAYASREDALRRIPAAIEDFYRNEKPDVYKARSADIQRSAKAVASVYERNVFPEMKLMWGTYINNIGHTDFPGCFRCHDEEHKVAGGGDKKLTQDCGTCHELLAMDEAAPKILTDLGLK
jgi:nitrate/TMAO reductase-like tetraheme cytochrome c subunit